MGVAEDFKKLAFLKNRKRAYLLAFGNSKIVASTHKAYLDVFGGPAGNEVLMDLVRFCRGTRPCFDEDPRIHALLEGRREVLLRINEHMNLTPEQLHALYDRRNILVPQPEGDDDDA